MKKKLIHFLQKHFHIDYGKTFILKLLYDKREINTVFTKAFSHLL
jgi:hypothetical protein